MRIYEVRHLIQSFVVYVNMPDDILTLKKNKDFRQYATYKTGNKTMGVEFAFKCRATTLNGAKKYVERILNATYKGPRHAYHYRNTLR